MFYSPYVTLASLIFQYEIVEVKFSFAPRYTLQIWLQTQHEIRCRRNKVHRDFMELRLTDFKFCPEAVKFYKT